MPPSHQRYDIYDRQVDRDGPFVAMRQVYRNHPVIGNLLVAGTVYTAIKSGVSVEDVADSFRRINTVAQNAWDGASTDQFTESPYGSLPDSTSTTTEATPSGDAEITSSQAEPSQLPSPTDYACSETMDVGGDVQNFADSLASGETGCLRGGTYDTGEVIFSSAGSTLASYPGERATLDFGSDFAIIESGANVTLSRLNLTSNGVHTVRVYGSNAVIESSHITNNQASGAGSCVSVGGSEDRPDGVMLRGNKFENCGNNDTNQNHAIYGLSFTNLGIVDNLFWNTGGYSIQLYPTAEAAIVSHNVIDGSNEYSQRGGLIAGDPDTDSNNHTIEYNIFSNTATQAVQIRVGSGHEVNNNCFFDNSAGDSDELTDDGTDGEAGGDIGGSGSFTQTGNITADPQFVNRASRDYRLASDSDCLATVGYDTAAKVDASW